MAKREKTKKVAKKDFWSKLEYWKRGGIVGFIFAIIIQTYEFIIDKGYTGILAIINGIPLLISVSIDKSLYLGNLTPFSITTVLVIIIWSIIVGIILGKIYGYLKIKYNKSTKFNMFILLILIILYLVIVIAVFLYVYIFLLIPET